MVRAWPSGYAQHAGRRRLEGGGERSEPEAARAQALGLSGVGIPCEGARTSGVSGTSSRGLGTSAVMASARRAASVPGWSTRSSPAASGDCATRRQPSPRQDDGEAALLPVVTAVRTRHARSEGAAPGASGQNINGGRLPNPRPNTDLERRKAAAAHHGERRDGGGRAGAGRQRVGRRAQQRGAAGRQAAERGARRPAELGVVVQARARQQPARREQCVQGRGQRASRRARFATCAREACVTVLMTRAPSSRQPTPTLPIAPHLLTASCAPGTTSRRPRCSASRHSSSGTRCCASPAGSLPRPGTLSSEDSGLTALAQTLSHSSTASAQQWMVAAHCGWFDFGIGPHLVAPQQSVCTLGDSSTRRGLSTPVPTPRRAAGTKRRAGGTSARCAQSKATESAIAPLPVIVCAPRAAQRRLAPGASPLRPHALRTLAARSVVIDRSARPPYLRRCWRRPPGPPA